MTIPATRLTNTGNHFINGTYDESSVVTNGLIMYLNGSKRSYPGSGSTWFDLSGNGNNVALSGNYKYDVDSNGPSILFNSGNQLDGDGRGTVTFPAGAASNSSYTFYMVLRMNRYVFLPSSTNISPQIFSAGRATGFLDRSFYMGRNGISGEVDFCQLAYYSSSGQDGPGGSGGASLGNIYTGTVYHVAATVQNTNPGQTNFYVNGVFAYSSRVLTGLGNMAGRGYNGTWSLANQPPTVPASAAPRAAGGVDSNFYAAMVYNRVLTPDEIYQNYQVLSNSVKLENRLTANTSSNSSATLYTNGIDEVSGASRIIQDSSMLLYLDATNPASYSGSGTTWYDLSGKNNNFTLYGNTKWRSDYGGVISLNEYNSVFGTDYFATTLNGTVSSDVGFTISFWMFMAVNINGSCTSYRLGGTTFYTNIGGVFRWVDPPYAGGGGQFGTSNLSTYLQQWRQVTTVIGNRNINVYVDGVFTSSFPLVNPSTSVINPYLQFGGIITGRDMCGYHSQILMYNRVLSPTEITSNYNAVAPRYQKPIITYTGVTAQTTSNTGATQIAGSFDEVTGMPVVDSSLQLWLDAANPASYPGTGTTWTDLSGKGNHGTIIPRKLGFKFNSTYLSFIDNGGLGTYAYMTTPIQTGAYSYTISISFRTYGPITGENHIFRTSGNFGCDIQTTSPYSIRYYMTEYNVETAYTPVNSIQPNVWSILTMVYDRDQKTQSIYINGVLVGTKSHSVQYNVSTNPTTWFARSDQYIGGINGDCGFIMMYNRVLTPAEIKENFNALRGRYGI